MKDQSGNEAMGKCTRNANSITETLREDLNPKSMSIRYCKVPLAMLAAGSLYCRAAEEPGRSVVLAHHSVSLATIKNSQFSIQSSQ